mgnify:FL=1|jgi:hypothetical protein
MYDLFVIAYDDSVWGDFKERYPHAKRVDPTDRVILECAIQSYTSMFWLVDYEFMIDPDWDFKYTVPIWDRNYIHTWQAFSRENEELGTYPLKLIPKQLVMSWDGRVDDLFENPGYIKPMTERVVHTEIFDIFFVSYNEPNADKNWQILSQRFPHAQRIHGIIGIDNAHRECAIRSTTNMFWTVDGDTIVDEDFTFEYIPPIYDRDYTHIWYSRNPINELEYGNGAVKLWPTTKVREYRGSWLDYTTSIGQLKIMEQTIATTAFNSSPYETWKSAFRECVKLSHNIENNPEDKESISRLHIWSNIQNNADFSDYCIKGACDALVWYPQNKTNLNLINKFSWLAEMYEYLNKESSEKVG